MDFDPEGSSSPRTYGERAFLIFFTTVILGLFAAEIIRDYKPVKLAPVFLLLFSFPLLVVHEGGHAVAAWLCGWHVIAIVLGMGGEIWRFRLWGAVVQVRALPVTGVVKPVPTDLQGVRWKSALIYLAGPLAELLVLLVLVLTIGFGTLTTPTEDLPIIAAQSACIAILMSVVVQLIPIPRQTLHASIIPDGLGIFWSFWKPLEHFEAQIGIHYDEEADALVRRDGRPLEGEPDDSSSRPSDDLLP